MLSPVKAKYYSPSLSSEEFSPTLSYSSAEDSIRGRDSYLKNSLLGRDSLPGRDSLLERYSLLSDIEYTKCGKSIYQLQEESERVRLNVSGTIFETYKKTLTQKEGSIFKLDNIRNYYDPFNDEYYFDRNPKAFEAIFVFMQCGILCHPPKVPYRIFIEELQFFGFGEKALKLFIESRGKPRKKVIHADRNTLLSTIWELLEFPETNKGSRYLTTFSMTVILLAVCLFSIDTLPEIANTSAATVIKKIEYFCVTWFTIEITVRFISSPRKYKFMMELMNIIDVISLVPYYVEMFLRNKGYSKLVVSSLRILRMARIFNLLKLYRYSRAIRVMAKTLYSSVAELLMLLFFVTIGMMLFSPLLYYFELNNDPKNEFRSIPHVFWFCIVTTTTVGYGDMVPATVGKNIHHLLILIH